MQTRLGLRRHIHSKMSIALIVVLLGSHAAVWGNADSRFADTGAGASDQPLIRAATIDESITVHHMEAVTVRSRPVEIELALLEQLHPEGGDRLQFDLFEDVTLNARFDRRETPAPEKVSWVGRLGDGDDASDWFILVKNQGTVVANFWTSDGRGFEIRPITEDTDVHVVREIHLNAFPPCETCAGPNREQWQIGRRDWARHAEEDYQPIGGTALTCGAEDDGSVIDVLVVYTPAARIAAGGTAAIQSLAHASISSTNAAYQNSGIETSVNLVHMAEIDYTEASSFGVDLTNLRTGAVPGVHALRDEYAADLVAMLNSGSGACGVAYLMQALSSDFESWAFSVTHHGCAVGNLTFAHELGHNQGCAHDIDNAGTSGAFPFSYGWRWLTSSGSLHRSVMAYSPGIRVPHFSNPDVTEGGAPTGSPGEADNATTINETAYTVANFRASLCAGPDESLCENAVVVGEGATAITNYGAATDGPEEPELCSAFADSDVQSDVWYIHETTCTGMLVVDMCDADFLTKIAAYEGGCPSESGSALACSVAACENILGTTLRVAVNEGDTIYLRIGGHLGAQGEGVMTITCDDCPADFAGPGDAPDGVVNVDDLLSLLNAWGTDCNVCPQDLTGPGGQPDGIINVDDLLVILNEWGPCE